METPKVEGREKRGVHVDIKVEFRAEGEGKAPKIVGHAAVFNTPSQLIGGVFPVTNQAQHRLIRIVAINPLETAPIKVVMV